MTDTISFDDLTPAKVLPASPVLPSFVSPKTTFAPVAPSPIFAALGIQDPAQRSAAAVNTGTGAGSISFDTTSAFPTSTSASPPKPSAPISFDDLIPAKAASAAPSVPAMPASGGASTLSFDDLIPKAGADPMPVSPSRGVSDMVRVASNALTMGYGDKLASWITGTPLEQERAWTQASTDRTGTPGRLAAAAGTVAPWLVGGEAAQGLAAAADGVPALGRALASPTLQTAGTGAGVGAIEAAGQHLRTRFSNLPRHRGSRWACRLVITSTSG